MFGRGSILCNFERLSSSIISPFNMTQQGYQPGLAPNWVILAPNRTNLGLFKISFSTFWLEPKYTESDLRKSQICPIWGQYVLTWIPNLTCLELSVIYVDG